VGVHHGRDGLLSDTVIAAAEDQDGVWFGTTKGFE
jgi:hypothetical protein